MDLNSIQKLVDEGYLSKRKHPDSDLFILNYTAKTQYEQYWNSITLKCRGLIVDSSGLIKAHCFPKFFNFEECLNEIESRRNLSFVVSEKMDGSLGILYWLKDKPFIATRGSFDSDQAVKATEILHDRYYRNLDKRYTYLVEIIYPQNRICVDYGDLEELFFLSAYNNETGEEQIPETQPFPVAKQHHTDLDFKSMKELNCTNREGFVIRFEDGYRFKIKFEEYRRLHDLIFSISSKGIWKALKDNSSIPLEKLPDEVYDWIKKTEKELKTSYAILNQQAENEFKKIQHLPRKEFALVASKSKLSSVLFKMLDKKSYSDILWKSIEPEYRTPKHEEI